MNPSKERIVVPHAVHLVLCKGPLSVRQCDLCHKTLSQLYFDAATLSGPWAYLCPECFWSFGRTLGLGSGQLFIRVDETEVKKPV